VADVQDIIGLVSDGEKMPRVRELLGKLNALLEELNGLVAPSDQKHRLTLPKPPKTRADKPEAPEAGTAPYKLVEVMSSKEPMTVEQIASAVGMKEGSIKQYLHKFACFRNQRGIGYTCTASGKSEQTERGEPIKGKGKGK